MQVLRAASAVTLMLAISMEEMYCSEQARIMPAVLSRGKLEGSWGSKVMPPATKAGL